MSNETAPGQRSIVVAMVVWAMGRCAREQLDADVPTMVSATKRSQRLYQLARGFAATGRDDPVAVAALRAAAGRHRMDLRRAAARVRMSGWATEGPIAYLANQLLLAAATDRPVRAVTPELDDWFQRIRQLDRGTVGEVFARLAAMQPLLANVERDVIAESEALGATSTDSRDSAAAAEIRTYIRTALGSLVGPGADADEPLLRSNAAYRNASLHLNSLLK